MNRLEKTLSELKDSGFNISSAKKLTGGINSAVYQVRSDLNAIYTLKLYKPPTTADPRERCKTEEDFLKYLSSLQIENVPKMAAGNRTNSWSLLEWVQGKQLKNLASQDIRDIAKFFRDINTSSTQQRQSQLPLASEAYISLSDLIVNISQRLDRLEMCSYSSDVCADASKWIRKELRPLFEDIKYKTISKKTNLKNYHP